MKTAQARFYTRRRGAKHQVVDRESGRVWSTHSLASQAWAERERLTDLAMRELRPPRPD